MKKEFPIGYLDRFPYYKEYRGKLPEGLKLNIGCGKVQFKGFVNVDRIDLGQEVIHNLEKFPLPFKDNSVSFILISHYLEHHSDIFGLFKELNRICKDGAIIDILVPYYTSENANCELDHSGKKFGWNTMNYAYDPYIWNIGITWEVIYKKIHFNKTCRTYTKPIWKFIDFIINNILINKFNLYEKFFCMIIISDLINYKLKVKKGGEKLLTKFMEVDKNV